MTTSSRGTSPTMMRTKQKSSLADRLNIGEEVRELKLGSTFNSKNSTTAFHTIKYDFKPKSVDKNRVAKVEVGSNNQVTVTMPNLESSGVPHTVYKGNQRKYTKECLIIIDKKTGDITLEKLNHNIQVKKTRSEMTNKPNMLQTSASTSTSAAVAGATLAAGGSNNAVIAGGSGGGPSKLENSTMRKTSKTKVSTGSRRNNIIDFKPRNSPLQQSSPSRGVATIHRSPQAAPAWHANNGQSTLPSIPMILNDDDGLFGLGGGSNSNGLHNAAANLSSSSTSSTASHNNSLHDYTTTTTNTSNNKQMQQTNNGNAAKRYNSHKRNQQHMQQQQQHHQQQQQQQQQQQHHQLQQQQQQLTQQELQRQQVLQWQQQLQQQQQQQQQLQQAQQSPSSSSYQRLGTLTANEDLTLQSSSNNRMYPSNGIADSQHQSLPTGLDSPQHDIVTQPFANGASKAEQDIGNLSSSSSSSDSDSSDSDSGSGSDSDDSSEENTTTRQQQQHQQDQMYQLPNLGMIGATTPPQQQQHHINNQNQQQNMSNVGFTNGFPDDLLQNDLQLSNSSDDDD